VSGSPKADRVTVRASGAGVRVGGLRVTTQIAGSETIDVLNVGTADGPDTVDVGDEIAALIGVAVDLGDGQR
jgi:hypothetical protein